jgi:glycerate-2-kinase
MIVRNRDKLAVTVLRGLVLDMVEAGIFRVLPDTVMKQAVKFDPLKKNLSIQDVNYDISRGRVFVVGGGKASGRMAQTLEEIMGPQNIGAGVVNGIGKNYKTRKIIIVEASHPTPDRRGVMGVEQMLALKNQYSIDKNDLVICLISGGGSALMPCPAEGIRLEDKQAITKLLIERGPAIQEINAVRKHLSATKGGRLGKFYSPAAVVSLIISDVVGNDLDAIASGPTVPDPTTFADAYNVLRKYHLLTEAPPNVVDVLKRGCAGKIEETPKQLDNCRSRIIGDNRLALEAMAAKARESGLKPCLVTAEQTGDPTAAAVGRAGEILASKYSDYDVILVGGETTPRLPDNHGKGGRNQHYAAVSMVALKNYPGEWVMASVGTDGADYLEGVAGAIVDKHSLQVAVSKNLEILPYLDRYDSHTLLEKLGHSLIKTDHTGTNVGDAAVYILK